MDEIARRTLSGGFQTIIATHSEAMIRRLPADLLRFTVRRANGTVVREFVSHDEVMVALSYQQSVKYLALVEDSLGEEILRTALALFGSDHGRSWDIVTLGAIAHTEGMVHQRFFHEIAEYLGLQCDFVRRTLIASWLNGVEVREQARAMVAGMESAVEQKILNRRK